jgi:folate-dependent tRNA-U54 methylase TrmFO/GidA
MVSELFHDIKDKNKDNDDSMAIASTTTPIRGYVTTTATTTTATTSPAAAAVQSKPHPVTPVTATLARITNTPSATGTKKKYPHMTTLFGENFDMNDKFTRDSFNSLLAEVVDIAAGDSDEFKVKNYNGNRTFHYLRIPVTDIGHKVSYIFTYCGNTT